MLQPSSPHATVVAERRVDPFLRFSFACTTAQRIVLVVLGDLLIVAGFVLIGMSDGGLDRGVAFFVLLGGLALAALCGTVES